MPLNGSIMGPLIVGIISLIEGRRRVLEIRAQNLSMGSAVPALNYFTLKNMTSSNGNIGAHGYNVILDLRHRIRNGRILFFSA